MVIKKIKHELLRSHSASDLYVWLTSNEDPYDPELAHKLLLDIKPSALSNDYLDYINTSSLFFKENLEFFHPGYDMEYASVSALIICFY